MGANLLGLASVALSVLAFAATYRFLKARTLAVKLAILFGFGVLSIPALSFSVYYLHILPERDWYFTFRSLPGVEFLVVFLGCCAGALASLLPRFLLGLPLAGLLAVGLLPYCKPFLGPLPDADIKDHWEGDACLQSTSSTCGPASVCSILRFYGIDASEREAARESHTYVGGTEAWYLARHVRRKGLTPRFRFGPDVTQTDHLPAMVGVTIGGMGHFIAVLSITDGQVTYVDPLQGRATVSREKFRKSYRFTGFQMSVARADAQD